MLHSADRLERALHLFAAHCIDGGSWQELLARHPDLAELLTALRGDAESGTDLAEAGRSEADTIAADGEMLGDFRLGRVVGQGGIGTVHEARDRLLGRRVAIKVLRPEYAASAPALVRFRREALTLARLDHPDIVRVLGVGDTGDRHWLAMEFVDGESLVARIERLRSGGGHTGDSLRNLVQAIAKVAAALHHVHEAGIVHRDVKPSNILLRADGSPVLTDFGIARDRDDPTLTRTGAVLGSPRYMAPEQVLGGGTACDARSDVFSLGSTLYECATLHPAFAGPSIEASSAAIVHSDPLDPRRLHRGVPADLAAIVMKALEKDPARRYATAKAFADELEAFLDLRQISARPPSRVRSWFRRVRRQPALGAFVVLAGIAAASSIWVATQWPRLAAAALAAQQRSYDDAVVHGFLARGKGDADRHWFDTAIRTDPTRSEAVLGLVFSTSRRHGAAAALAELDARAAGSDDPNFARCRAWLFERLQRRPEADALRRSIGEPATAMGLWLEAMLCLESRETDAGALARARELLSLAVRIAPQPNLVLHCQWAAVVGNGGGVGERREAAEALARLWPEQPLAMYLSGAVLVQIDPEGAVRRLRRALELGSDDPSVQANLGIALARRGDHDGALAALREAFARLRSDDPMRSTVLTLVGQLDPAVADQLAGAWRVESPDSPAAWRFAARAAWRGGDNEAAIDLLRRAVAAMADDVDARLDLMFALVNGGDVADAIASLREMLRSHPGHERVHMQLLDALDASGDTNGALAELQRWAEAHPDDPAAWRDLAAALAKLPPVDGDDRLLAAAERADYLASGRDDVARELHAAALERRGEAEAATLVRSRPSRFPTK